MAVKIKLVIAESVAAPELQVTAGNILSAGTNLSASIDGAEVAVDVCEVELFADYAINTGLFIPAGADSLTTSDNKLFYCGVDENILPLIPYGTKIEYYEDDDIIGVFYLESVTRVAKQAFRLDLMSGLGLLENKVHRGGVYNGTTLADMLAEIIDTTFPYTVDPAIASWPCFGWLPYETARENLHRVLMAMGVNIFKANGSPYFSLLDDSSPIVISDDNVYIDGKVNYGSPATSVAVTEHQWLEAGGESEVLFDNSDGAGYATSVEVSFSEPYYNLTTTGTLVIDSSGANYAIVTGVGELIGTPYTHVQKIITKSTNPGNVKNREVSVADVGLVNPLNSNNVCQRLLDYYSAAQTVSGKMILGTPRPGSAITVTDAFGDLKTGIIKDMDITSSATVAASFEAVTDYTPAHMGNEFEASVLIDTSGTYTIPDGVTHIRAVLIGGGDGGQGGADGEDGKGIDDMTHTVTSYQNIYYYDGNEPDAGKGGAGGTAGTGGKILIVDQDVTPGEVLTISVGVGGAGGLANGYAGGTGTATTVSSISLGTKSTADPEAASIDYGWKNLITGKTYGQKGIDGMNGGDGGKSEQPGEASNVPGAPAGANVWDWAGFAITASTKGGGGGGSGYNKSGMPGGPGRISYDHYADGGSGGAGTSFSQNQGPHTEADEYGKGGDGGYGGGGGGNGGGVDARSTTQSGFGSVSISGGIAGAGGYGSPGADGGNGAVIILY